GSIPLGSTSLRPLRGLRLGKPASASSVAAIVEGGEGCRVVARRAKTGRTQEASISSLRGLRLRKPASASSVAAIVGRGRRLPRRSPKGEDGPDRHSWARISSFMIPKFPFHLPLPPGPPA